MFGAIVFPQPLGMTSTGAYYTVQNIGHMKNGHATPAMCPGWWQCAGEEPARTTTALFTDRPI